MSSESSANPSNSWRPCPFEPGRRYRVRRSVRTFREQLQVGEELTFVRDTYSRYDGATGYVFTDALGALRVYDVADEPVDADWVSVLALVDDGV